MEDEYEYAVQWVSKEGGRVIQPSQHEWGSRDDALYHQAHCQKHIQGRFTFILVRRRKVGPIEPVPDDV